MGRLSFFQSTPPGRRTTLLSIIRGHNHNDGLSLTHKITLQTGVCVAMAAWMCSVLVSFGKLLTCWHTDPIEFKRRRPLYPPATWLGISQNPQNIPYPRNIDAGVIVATARAISDLVALLLAGQDPTRRTSAPRIQVNP